MQHVGTAARQKAPTSRSCCACTSIQRRSTRPSTSPTVSGGGSGDREHRQRRKRNADRTERCRSGSTASRRVSKDEVQQPVQPGGRSPVRLQHRIRAQLHHPGRRLRWPGRWRCEGSARPNCRPASSATCRTRRSAPCSCCCRRRRRLSRKHRCRLRRRSGAPWRERDQQKVDPRYSPEYQSKRTAA